MNEDRIKIEQRLKKINKYRNYKQRSHFLLNRKPRVCGEHKFLIPFGIGGYGSPPRMRGTRPVETKKPGDRGITPAYAGNTTLIFVCTSWLEDHPRVCGEHIRHNSPLLPLRGSPPRMRGTPYGYKVENGQYGITPAYAGNTIRP